MELRRRILITNEETDMRKTMTALTLLFSLILCVTAGCEAMGLKKAEYHPKIDPADFSAKVDNPYMPLVPGTVLKYRETDKDEVSENIITVTHETKTVMGCPCVVVHDVLMKQGKVAEDTYDWYSQDKQGNVWYFGEATKEISPGRMVSTQGSWESGVKGGQPGIIMPGDPKPGAPYRQEYGPGQAEDMGQVIANGESVTVPAGHYDGCVKTKDWSMLEPGHESKWYAKGIGVVRSESTGGEVAVLLSVTRP
jgi:hypothetical protein